MLAPVHVPPFKHSGEHPAKRMKTSICNCFLHSGNQPLQEQIKDIIFKGERYVS